MKGLIFALNNYKWSSEITEKAKMKILEFVSFIATAKTSLLHKLAVFITERFVTLIIKDKKLEKDILKLKKDDETISRKLSKV
ncbi:MAG: hypothetical protein U0T83_02540 [Bacteriovoracaceae bacterium]